MIFHFAAYKRFAWSQLGYVLIHNYLPVLRKTCCTKYRICTYNGLKIEIPMDINIYNDFYLY